VQQLERAEREAVLVEDAAVIRMMGLPVLEALPSRRARYEQVDPFILVHEDRFGLCDFEGVDTKHPHRGFDNVWYVIEGWRARATAPAHGRPAVRRATDLQRSVRRLEGRVL
jgi:hypothetical protein